MKKTNKIIVILLALALTLALAACGGSSGGDGTNVGADMSVLEILQQIMSKVELEIDTDTVLLDSENFEYFAFLEYKEGYEAACNEAMINAIAHSVVLARVPDGEDASAAAADIKANANPRKWVCVEAEKCEVIQNGNLILLVMSDVDRADAVINSFNEFCKGE